MSSFSIAVLLLLLLANVYTLQRVQYEKKFVRRLIAQAMGKKFRGRR